MMTVSSQYPIILQSRTCSPLADFLTVLVLTRPMAADCDGCDKCQMIVFSSDRMNVLEIGLRRWWRAVAIVGELVVATGGSGIRAGR